MKRGGVIVGPGFVSVVACSNCLHTRCGPECECECEVWRADDLERAAPIPESDLPDWAASLSAVRKALRAFEDGE